MEPGNQGRVGAVDMEDGADRGTPRIERDVQGRLNNISCIIPNKPP